jgi:general secretion pathway protein N
MKATKSPSTPWRMAWAGALVGLVLATVVYAPARWLSDALQSASGDQLQLQEPRGSVWTGSAQLVLAAGAGSADATALPGRVHWRIRPDWNGFHAEVQADCCTPQPLQAAAHLDGVGTLVFTLADSQSQWPASLLGGLGTPWNTVQPQGQLNVSSQALGAQWQQGRWTVSGQAQMDVTQLSSRLSTLTPMGSYRLTLQGGSPARLVLATLEGSLQLSGQGQWVGQTLRFKGEASAAPDRQDALSNLLNILGRREGTRTLINLG